MWRPQFEPNSIFVTGIVILGWILGGQIVPTPSEAGGGFLDTLNRAARTIERIPRGLPTHERRERGSSHSDTGNPSKSRGSDTGNSSESSSDSNEKSKGEKTVADVIQNSKNAATAAAEWHELVRAAKLEKGRNVSLAITTFIEDLKEKHKEILKSNVNVSAATGLNINQVTVADLNRGIEEAYKEAKLNKFEKFAGELWTRDRLLVRVIRHAQTGLPPYFQGVGAKGPNMTELNELFTRSAREVYSKALEIAEVVGVSLSFDRFIRTMYENADRDDGLWIPDQNGRYEQPDGKYELIATALIDSESRETFIQDGAGLAADTSGLEKQFQYRYRARRALSDCLNAHYTEFLNGGPTGTGKTIETAYSGEKGAGGSGALGRIVPPSKGMVPEIARPVANNNDARGQRPTTVITFDSGGPAWIRAQTFVNQFCRDPTLAVAIKARDRKIEPVSARTDTSSSSDGNSGGGVLPTSSQQAR